MDQINFNQKTGKHSFLSTNEKPWHEKGQIADRYLDSISVLKESGLDYQVKKELITFAIPDGPVKRSDNTYFTYRDDTFDILGEAVGKVYTIVQNTDAFRFFDEIASGAGVLYETAGALGKGERIFITATLPSYITVSGDDKLEKYIFLYNSHDGKGSIVLGFTPIRIVCNNTLNAALRTCKNKVKIRHTESAKVKLKKAHEFLGICDQFSEQFGQMMQQWTKQRISETDFRKLIERAIASKETLELLDAGNREDLPKQFTATVDDILHYADLHPSQKMLTTRGTLYGTYNAVTGFFQNVKEYKNPERKFLSIMEGTTYDKTQACFNLCEAFFSNGNIVLQ